MIMIDTTALASIRGGVERGQSPEQLRARYNNVCLSPDPRTARQHYDTMLSQMVPDSSEAPGFKRRVVKSIGQLCHWPFPGNS